MLMMSKFLSKFSDFFHLERRRCFAILNFWAGSPSSSISSSITSSPASSNISSGSSAAISTSLASSPASPAVGGNTITFTTCRELDTTSRISSVLTSIVFLLPSKVSSSVSNGKGCSDVLLVSSMVCTVVARSFLLRDGLTIRTVEIIEGKCKRSTDSKQSVKMILR
ncbi:hypothetical protein T10_714 [Trichinella papuae]|uniref:Uncharacterized protein n=1 Tax=Trichinella papuae TaxID=268474 RepID=A0A0V1M1P0_9BILA|nr:hypothetical protein T10_4074 [Trichinella papuae]KRZ65986.1 hypothetical protein T10_714 [Trichinella papuae]